MTLAPRSDFPLLAAHPGAHYLDSAATSQKPRAVLDAMRAYYEDDNANPHRGAYALVGARDRPLPRGAGAHRALPRRRRRGVRSSSRAARPSRINLVATAWGRANVRAGDEIVVTGLEHHANFVPWQQLALERAAHAPDLRRSPTTGEIDLDHLTSAARPPHAGRRVQPRLERARHDQSRARDRRARARAVWRAPGLRRRAERAAFPRRASTRSAWTSTRSAATRCCGPMGIGGLIGRRALLEAMPPYQTGGDMIEFVHDDRTTWNVLPHKFEAGTPNVADAVGLAAAVRLSRAPRT